MTHSRSLDVSPRKGKVSREEVVGRMRLTLAPWLNKIARNEKIDWPNFPERLLTCEEFIGAVFGEGTLIAKGYEMAAQGLVRTSRPTERRIRFFLSDAVRLLQQGFQAARTGPVSRAS